MMSEVMIENITLEDLKDIRFTGVYTDQMAEVADKIFDELKLVDISARIPIVHALIEQYYDDTKDRPKGDTLTRLGWALAWDYMEGDKRRDKVMYEEYPILTEAQIERRTTGQFRNRDASGQHRYEVPLEYASNYSIDHVDFSLPVRKF